MCLGIVDRLNCLCDCLVFGLDYFGLWFVFGYYVGLRLILRGECMVRLDLCLVFVRFYWYYYFALFRLL